MLTSAILPWLLALPLPTITTAVAALLTSVIARVAPHRGRRRIRGTAVAGLLPVARLARLAGKVVRAVLRAALLRAAVMIARAGLIALGPSLVLALRGSVVRLVATSLRLLLARWRAVG